MFKRLIMTVYLLKNFAFYAHKLLHGVLYQFDMSISGYNPSADNAVKMSIVDCL